MLLNEYESKKLLTQTGINVVATELARDMEEAVAISRRLGYPIVLKIVSPEITHKSDAGGVKLNLLNPEAVALAYDEIMMSVNSKFPQACIQGIAVQQMAQPGLEVIIGMYQDKQFGPNMMFGLGGIWVELLKDVSSSSHP
jgi:acyl-CoA synthetase (NDP forming)